MSTIEIYILKSCVFVLFFLCGKNSGNIKRLKEELRRMSK